MTGMNAYSCRLSNITIELGAFKSTLGAATCGQQWLSALPAPPPQVLPPPDVYVHTVQSWPMHKKTCCEASVFN